MKHLFLSISILLFFYSCDSDGGSSTGPSANPVYTVNMGLSGVESDFATNESAQETFLQNLANQLNISFNRIQILNITTPRGSVNIELLFLEDSSGSEPSVTSLLADVVSIEEVGDYGVEEVAVTESSSAESAEYILQAANTELGNILEVMFDCGNALTSTEGYSSGIDCDDLDETDFAPAYDLYLEALLHNPSSPGANFGAGITEMLSITHDPILEEFIEEWDEWDDGGTSATPVTDRQKFASFNSGLPVGADAFLMPENINFTSYLPLEYLFDNFVNRHVLGDNHDGRDGESIISDMMDVIDNVFITRLTNSINYLGNATGQGFVFEITPQMQGNIDQDHLDFDDTEIYLLKASMHTLRFMLYSMTAYDLDVGQDVFEEDDIQDFSFLDQNSDFLTLRDGKENYFPNAHADITNMLTSLTAAYDFLASDNFTANDITLWEDISGEGVEVDDEWVDIDDFIKPQTGGTIYDFFNSNIEIEDCEYECGNCPYAEGDYNSYYEACYCWWDGSIEPHTGQTCTDLTINIGNFMTNPPSNLKDIVPDYTISTNYEAWLEQDGEGDMWSVELNLLSCMNSEITNSCNPDGEDCGDHHGTEWYKNSGDSGWNNTNVNGPLSGCSAIEQYLQQIHDDIEAEVSDTNNGNYDTDWCYDDPFTWGGSIYIWLDQYLGSGDFIVNVDVNYYGCWIDHEYEPCLDWSANTFDAWKNQWDVSIGNLFPLMQPGPFFNDYLSVDQDDWDEDINDSECLDF